MSTYRVVWLCDFEATSRADAVAQAVRVLRDPAASEALLLVVTTPEAWGDEALPEGAVRFEFRETAG